MSVLIMSKPPGSGLFRYYDSRPKFAVIMQALRDSDWTQLLDADKDQMQTDMAAWRLHLRWLLANTNLTYVEDIPPAPWEYMAASSGAGLVMPEYVED